MGAHLRWALLVPVLVVGVLLGRWLQMPNDIQDWSSHQQSFKRVLYPIGAGNTTPPTPSFTTNPGQTIQPNILLPPATVQVRVSAQASGVKFSYQLLALGAQSHEQYFGDTGAPGTPIAPDQPTLPFTFPVDADWDTQLNLTVVGDPVRTVNYYVSALFQAESPGQAGSSTAVFQPTPAAWQSPDNGNGGGVGAVAAGGTLTLVPAPPGTANTYLHAIWLDVTAAAGAWLDLETLSGIALGVRVDCAIGGPRSYTWPGRKVLADGVRAHNTSPGATNAINFGTSFRYS